jgi:NADH-quinone oxidoreductase subunit H
MMTLTMLLSSIVKILVMVGFLFNVGGLLTWVDRRQSAMIQDRVGPNRAVIKIGKFELRIAGLLHTAADGVKFFFKEDFMPPKADKLLFSLAPILVMAPVLALVAVIPMTDTISIASIHQARCMDGETAISMLNALGGCDKGIAKTFWPAVSRLGVNPSQGLIDGAIAPLNIGILYVFALAGQGIVGASIAGWSSDNKFSLMGALRAASQMVSYEVAIGLSLVGAMMTYGTVRLDEMVRWQGDNAWGIFVQPVAAVLFFVSAIAETKRIPFDLPEAESELVSGYFTEYSGMKFGMFYFAEYMEIVTSSMLFITIFLGGWQLPFFHRDGLTIAIGDTTLLELVKVPHIWMSILGVVAFYGKTLAICFIQAFIRWSLPRFRYDQLMRLGWRVLLPAALGNILVTGVTILALKDAGPEVAKVMQTLADVTQGLVAGLLAFLGIRAMFWIFSSRTIKHDIIGSSAGLAADAGGTQETSMQS